MKIVHTGDWHIGKIVNEFSMIEDQRYIIGKLIDILKREKADVLIIAGDIYDRSIPPVEAVELLNETFSKIVMELGIKIVAIGGNHDSGERVHFGSEIFEKNGLFIYGGFHKEVKKVTIEDEYGEVDFYLIPYVDPSVIKKEYSIEGTFNHNDAMKIMIDEIEKVMDKTKRNVAVAHGYVTMNREKAIGEENIYEVAELETSDSERPLSIGGTELIDGNLFKIFDYTALGHLHGRQRIGQENIRYSGSLLKYSFSEIKQRKGVTIVNLKNKNEFEIIQEEYKPLREMRIIEGPIDGLLEAGRNEVEGREDYILAVLKDEGEIIDPIGKLRTVYPNIMQISRETKKNEDGTNTSARDGYKEKNPEQLFSEFYAALGNGDYTEEKQEVIKEVIELAMKGVE